MNQDKLPLGKSCLYITDNDSIVDIKHFFLELSNKNGLSEVLISVESNDNKSDSVLRNGEHKLVDLFREMAGDVESDVDQPDISEDCYQFTDKELLEETFVTLQNLVEVESIEDCCLKITEDSPLFIEGEYNLFSFIENLSYLIEDVFDEKYNCK